MKKRSAPEPVKTVKSIVQYNRKANETEEMIKNLVETFFSGMHKVSQDNIEPFLVKLESVQQTLNDSFELGRNSLALNSAMQPLESVIKTMIDFIQTSSSIVDPLQDTILDVVFKTSDFTKVFEEKIKHYGETVSKVSEEVNNLVDKVSSFLNKVQLRQKGLDIRDYKPWDEYQHCSSEVCLRFIQRSSALYRNLIFLWKYPHLDDLSSTSLSKTGRWLVPGLFDDYKIRSIAQLSSDEMLLGMRGVAANTEKPSLLVVISTKSSNNEILKIIQLEKDGQPFLGDVGGIAVVKSQLIWMSAEDNLYGVRVLDLRDSMTSNLPSTITISKTKSLHYPATSISYDDRNNEIWILGKSRVRSYAVSPFGDILQENTSIIMQEHTRGFTIVRQFGIKYACVAKCSLVAGYQCRLEFHKIDTGVLDESTILRVVRTPTGLEALQTVSTEHIVVAFSSGTFSEKEKIQRIGGDFEDRYFKLNVPILKTEFSISENCLYCKLGGRDWLFPRQRLFPFGEVKCGTRRKRRSLEKALDRDVYTEEMEKHHRVRRQAAEETACIWSLEGKPFTGNYMHYWLGRVGPVL